MIPRKRGRRILAGAIALTMVKAPIAAAACATSSELEARHVRLLQTELMVAALSCKHGDSYDYGAQYNAFVTKFRGSLQHHAAVLKQEYRRSYGAQHETQLDRYVTQIANDASERSLHTPNYCSTVRPVFDDVLALKASELARYSESLSLGSAGQGVACAPGKQAAQKQKAQLQ